MSDIQVFRSQLKGLEQQFHQFLQNPQISHDNNQRRKLYSEVELLRLDIDDMVDSLNKDEVLQLTQVMDQLIKSMPLVPIKRGKKWFTPLEMSLRFMGMAGTFILCGSFLSLPILFLRGVDIAMNNDPFQYISERIKHWITKLFLLQAGIDLEIQGLNRDRFASSCAIMTFNHASNLDGFFVADTCPIRQLAFGKKELFVVPFFSWFSLAIGGVPVDRGNRDRAVQALQRCVHSAKQAKICIAVAPEGTRSTTGQLLPFKKGPFYMWEELRSPIVPFIIFGAYDIYPVGTWINQTGKIVVRYLPPLVADDQITRDDMLKKLRRQMLLALADSPSYVGQDISTGFWLTSILANLTIVGLNYATYAFGRSILVDKMHLSGWQILGLSSSVILAITAGLYVYYVYLADMFGAKFPSSKRK